MRNVLLALSFVSISGLVFSQTITIDRNVTMLALGDSYTIGESVEIQERWPHQFVDELRKLGVSAEYPDYIATTGWTTRNLIQGIESQLDEDKPYNLVSILIGVNNQYQGIDIAGYEPDLREIIDRALEIVDQDLSRVFMLSIPDYAFTPFGNGNEGITEEIDDYNAINERIAAEYKITYIDITPISRNGLNNPSLVAGDGLHPSADQYRQWVQEIIPKIKLDFNPTSTLHPLVPPDDLRIYPNPAGARLYLESSLSINRIQIYDMTGSLVSDMTVTAMPVSIDLSSFLPSIYSICAHSSTGSNQIFQRTFIISPD